MPFDRILSPFGKATTIHIPEPSGTLVVPVFNNQTIVYLGALTGAIVVGADIDPEVRPGAKICLEFESAPQHDIIWRDGFRGRSRSSALSTPQIWSFIYNGGEFIEMQYRIL